MYKATKLKRFVVRGPSASSTFVPIIRNNVVPLVGGGAGDEGDHRFGIAHVEDFVRHAGFDVDEIAGFVFDRLLAAGPEFVTHFSFDDVKDYFEVDMDMRIRNSARRDCSYVCGQV